jgi:drug/metabolite transporter (DMT)-like permease
VSSWIPGSRAAWAILVVGAVCVVPPAFYAAGAAILGSVCFDECSPPVDITWWALVAVMLALSPLVVVRVFQGEHPASARGRLAVAAVLVLAQAALAWSAWTGAWPN